MNHERLPIPANDDGKTPIRAESVIIDFAAEKAASERLVAGKAVPQPAERPLEEEFPFLVNDDPVAFPPKEEDPITGQPFNS